MSESIRLVKGKGLKCPVCGASDGCLLMPHRNAVICMRVQEGCAKRRDGSPITAKGNMGFLHRLDDKKAKALAKKTGGVAAPKNKYLTHAEVKAMVKKCKADLSPKRLNALCESLGLSERALKAYGIGFDVLTGCYSFPMWDGSGKYCGIRLRSHDGKRKLCVKGSKPGLFIPEDFDPHPIDPTVSDDDKPYVILLPEGPTDCAAAFDCGFCAIGRPSNSGGSEAIEQLIRRSCPLDLIVVADNDETKWLKDGTPFWPGIEGALHLLERVQYLPGLRRFVLPPVKDIRDWLKQGGYVRVIAELIGESKTVTPMWLRKANDRIKKRKAAERREPVKEAA